MFQHMFSAMNDMLDQLIQAYPQATGTKKQQCEEQIVLLKQMSDTLVEHWIEFEEKFSAFMEMEQQLPGNQGAHGFAVKAKQGSSEASAAAAQSMTQIQTAVTDEQLYEAELSMEVSAELAELIAKGQGYYNLFMFSHAASQFQMAVSQLPECNLARLFLAMTYMHLQNWSEAQRHFQLLVALTDYPKWRALGYNALGCIQAVHMNLEHAEQFFMKAYEACPSFKDSLANLKCCQETPQQLSLFFGSTELCCL
ncbi:hypothetical protein [Paenibacillus sp. NPDC058071]|uniref:hypothetical protein n=1 Tax=Paenibacillus sp. NPDC058071 TaxID=3346326 RepID=UPI0036DB5B70